MSTYQQRKAKYQLACEMLESIEDSKKNTKVRMTIKKKIDHSLLIAEAFDRGSDKLNFINLTVNDNDPSKSKQESLST